MQLVFFAYHRVETAKADEGIVLPDQIAGLPGWADSTEFDVEGKVDENPDPPIEKLSQRQIQERNQRMMQSLLAERFKLRIHHESRNETLYTLEITKRGSKLKDSDASASKMFVGHRTMTATGMPIDELVENLSFITGRIVLDRTGLTGRYDFSLKWTPDTQEQSSDDQWPSIFTAIEEQLGLKLHSAKGPVDILVVDHIERPSAN